MNNQVIRARIVRIGNSRGIRLPKEMLDRVGKASEIEVRFERSGVRIRPAKPVRQGWDSRFKAMAQRGDDALLDEPTSTAWDDAEWRW